MLRSATVVLAILVGLGSSGLSTSALASGGFRNIPRDGYRGRGNRAGGLGEFGGYGGRDVWGHWGAYYGPLIPTI
jgi:hypothetical protein